MDLEEVRLFADGRIFTGRQALELNLVDVLGDYQTALDIAAEMVGMETPPKTVREVPRRRRSMLDLLGQAAAFLLGETGAYDGYTEPLLQYRYR